MSTVRHLVHLDRGLELLPLFRLSDSTADEGALQYAPAPGTRWRVLAAPGDRLPGTFDQDVYVGLLHRWTEAGCPTDGTITFRLHAFLRSLGRKADGRTYEQLRSALTRLERTTLESTGCYRSAVPPAAPTRGAEGAAGGTMSGTMSGTAAGAPEPAAPDGGAPLEGGAVAVPGGATVGGAPVATAVAAPTLAAVAPAVDLRFSVLASVVIERRRHEDQEQLALFPSLAAHEPGDARVTLGPALRANVGAGMSATLHWGRYVQLGSPVARRLYRLLSALAPEIGAGRWRAPLDRWAEQLPLTQRYPSHLQRVLQPAHEMLLGAGVVRAAAVVAEGREWFVEYVLG